MDVSLPDGCNIIQSATSFYNYTNGNRTRRLYYLYEGRAYLANETTSNTAYVYSGTCLSTGDLVFQPQSKVYFSHLAVLVFIVITWLAVRAFFRPWWRVLR